MSGGFDTPLSIPCEYFDMDPHELNTRQLDYELMLRGLPLTGSARTKAKLIKQYLRDEASGRRDLAFLNQSPFQSQCDLEHCSFLCHELNEQMREARIDSRTLTTYWNRAVHLNARLERIHPQNASEQQQRSNLLFDARAITHAIAQRRDPHNHHNIFQGELIPPPREPTQRQQTPVFTSQPRDSRHRTVQDIERELQGAAQNAQKTVHQIGAHGASHASAISNQLPVPPNWFPPLSSSSRQSSARNSIETRLPQNVAQVPATAISQIQPAPPTSDPGPRIEDCQDDEEIIRARHAEKDLLNPDPLSTNTWDEIGRRPVQDIFSIGTPSAVNFQAVPPSRTRRTHFTRDSASPFVSTSRATTAPPMVGAALNADTVVSGRTAAITRSAPMSRPTQSLRTPAGAVYTTAAMPAAFDSNLYRFPQPNATYAGPPASHMSSPNHRTPERASNPTAAPPTATPWIQNIPPQNIQQQIYIDTTDPVNQQLARVSRIATPHGLLSPHPSMPYTGYRELIPPASAENPFYLPQANQQMMHHYHQYAYNAQPMQLAAQTRPPVPYVTLPPSPYNAATAQWQLFQFPHARVEEMSGGMPPRQQLYDANAQNAPQPQLENPVRDVSNVQNVVPQLAERNHRRERQPDANDSDPSSSPSSSSDDSQRRRRRERRRDGDEAHGRHRRRLKAVPITQWRINFSGDANSTNKNDLNLHNFLDQVEMFRRAGGIRRQELLEQICHLLGGSARAWFQNVYRRINTWQEFEAAIRAKFLAVDYNFALMAEVENRLQEKTEPVSNYINEMELKFRAMPIPLSEEHQLYIIQRNLLDYYTDRVVPQNPTSIRELEALCKRIESARAMKANRNANANPATQKPATTRDKPKYRSVHAVSEAQESQSSSENDSDNQTVKVEVCAASSRRESKRKPSQKPSKRSDDDKQVAKAKQTESQPTGHAEACYNCKADGHIQRDCTEPMRKRCYKCGLENYTVNNCPKCRPENEKKAQASQVDVEQPSSPKNTAL